jgi:hypothetical protein
MVIFSQRAIFQSDICECLPTNKRDCAGQFERYVDRQRDSFEKRNNSSCAVPLVLLGKTEVSL